MNFWVKTAKQDTSIDVQSPSFFFCALLWTDDTSNPHNKRCGRRSINFDRFQEKRRMISSSFFLVLLLVAAAILSLSNAIAPPHPDLHEESERHRSLHEELYPNVSYVSQPLPPHIWEPASEYKRRLRLEDPLDPVAQECDTCQFGTEACRYLSALDCQEMEDHLLEQAELTRKFIKSGGGRQSVDTTPTAGLLSTRSANPQTKQQQQQQQQGKQQSTQINTLVILVLWKGHEGRKNWVTKSDINKLWNGNGVDNAIIPTGSIATYTKSQSHGTVTLKAEIVDWTVTGNTEAYYANSRSGLPKRGDNNAPHLLDAYHFVLDKMDKAGFNFGKFDADKNKIIDHVQFLHSGYSAEMGGVDCNSNSNQADRIWSHMLPVGYSDWESKSGLKLGSLSTSSVFSGKCGDKIAPIGVMMHEMYHTLGIPDLYDREGGLSPGLGGIGAYDMISSPYGARGDQRYPGSLSPWSKLHIGFTQAVEIKTNGTYVARPSSTHADYYIIRKGFEHEGEYILIENRMNTGIDEQMWSNGILIYKIDETKTIQSNEGRGYPGMSAWPGNGKHYQVALLQADGEYDLEKGRNNGDDGDYYRLPSQELAPGPATKVSTKNGNYPNTDSYALGDIQPGLVTINEFRETNNQGTYSFKVEFDYEPPCQEFRLDLRTDDYPDEISWTLTQDSTKKVAMEGQGPGTSVRCLEEGECFTWTITDSKGDGMCCETGEGSYSASLEGTEIPGFSGGKTFKKSEKQKFCVTATQAVSPTKQPTPAPVATNPPIPKPTSDPVPDPTPAPVPAPQPTPPPVPAPTQPTPPPVSGLAQTPVPNPTNPPVPNPTSAPVPNLPDPTPAPTPRPTQAPTVRPTPAPTLRPTPRPTPPPTPMPTQSCVHSLEVFIRTDDKPEETTWEITTPSGIFITGFRSQDSFQLEPDVTYRWLVCFQQSNLNLYLKIHDSGSDGISTPGGFLIRLDGSDLLLDGVVSGASRSIQLRMGRRLSIRSVHDEQPTVTFDQTAVVVTSPLVIES
ncbi:MAG: hypothetical protein SGILL_004987 [Bacillariaceae sp.]